VRTVVRCRRKVGLVDLDMFAAGLGQTAEVVVQQLAKVEHHRGEIAIMLVIGDCGQQVRPGHRDLDRFARERRYRPEFID